MKPDSRSHVHPPRPPCPAVQSDRPGGMGRGGPGFSGVALLVLLACSAWVALVRPGPVGLPFFWDEADVYVPGAAWLAGHGLDFRPGVFPDDWSRGHPPLLYLLAGLAFRLFGCSPLVGHLLVLPFAVLALACTWSLASRLWGPPAGAGAALLLGATPLFMSMANMLLPEMPLTALAAASMLLFARGNLWGAAALGSVGVLTKETGVFVPAALAGSVLVEAWRERGLTLAATWRRFAICCLPIGVLLAFFAWQKALAGYFVFPHHQGLLWERPFGARDLWTAFPSMLFWHGRWVAVLAAVAAVLWRAGDGEAEPGGPGGAPPVGRGPAGDRWLPAAATVVAAIVLLVAGNALFFAKMFWLPRYALPAHPGVAVLVAGALLGRHRPRARTAALLGLALPVTAGLGAWGMRAAPPPDEPELTFVYADVIETHRAAFAALPRGAVVLTAWPMTEELARPELGYVDVPVRSVHAMHLDDPDLPHFDHVLISPSSDRAPAMEEAARRRGMRELGTFRRGAAPQPLLLFGP